MIRWQTVGAALGLTLIAAGPAHSDAGTDWMGRYTPVSAVCKGMILVVVPHRLSYADCVSVTYSELPLDSGFAAQVDEHAGCTIAGRIVTLTPSADGGNTLSIFDTEKAWHSGLPAIVCAYSK